MARVSNALVVDASLAVKWYLPDEPDADLALRLLRQFQAGTTDLVAPTHIDYEVASAITVGTRSTPSRLSTDQGQAAIDAFINLGLPTMHHSSLVRDAYQLSVDLNIVYYDALYVALAQQLGLSLITADRRLYHRISHMPTAVWIATWSPSA